MFADSHVSISSEINFIDSKCHLWITVIQLLNCTFWCQRLLRWNEYCCYKLLLRVVKKKSKHFCSILWQMAVLKFMPVIFAFWMSCGSFIGILENDGLLTSCAVFLPGVLSHCISFSIINILPLGRSQKGLESLFLKLYSIILIHGKLSLSSVNAWSVWKGYPKRAKLLYTCSGWQYMQSKNTTELFLWSVLLVSLL